MRIFQDPREAVREVERDLWEMGHDVQVQTMQDKDVRDDPNFMTKELEGYGFKIHPVALEKLQPVLDYMFKGEELAHVTDYVTQEFADRSSGVGMNPGNAWKYRPEVWSQFLQRNDKFAYTYSERFAPQLSAVINELRINPSTRQAIITMHSNINTQCVMGENRVDRSMDFHNKGGVGRIPCSMYYQFRRRNGLINLDYVMRSCDFLTHFPIDITLAMMLQCHVGAVLGMPAGTFTYYTGSLHAYHKDMKVRGIF